VLLISSSSSSSSFICSVIKSKYMCSKKFHFGEKYSRCESMFISLWAAEMRGRCGMGVPSPLVAGSGEESLGMDTALWLHVTGPCLYRFSSKSIFQSHIMHVVGVNVWTILDRATPVPVPVTVVAVELFSCCHDCQCIVQICLHPYSKHLNVWELFTLQHTQQVNILSWRNESRIPDFVFQK